MAPLSEKAIRSRDRSYKQPKLQHRHFAFIAQCIRDIPTPSARVEAAGAFYTSLKHTNAAFDGYRFNDACNIEESQYTSAGLDLAITYAAFWLDHLTHERKRRDHKI